MSRIDELQRLHEAARNPGPFDGPGAWESLTGGLVHSWPAIHRVLMAAMEVAANEADDIDSRLRYVEVRPGRDEWNELVEALRALDGGKGAT